MKGSFFQSKSNGVGRTQWRKNYVTETIIFVGVTVMVTGVAMGQNPGQQHIDLRPALAKKNFNDGKHLIKTLPDGRKVSLGFKAGKVVEIFLIDKKGKELRGVLAEGKVSHDGVLPPQADRSPRKFKIIELNYRGVGGCLGSACSNDQEFDIGEIDGVEVFINIVTCC